MAKIATSFDILCIQYQSSTKGIRNIAVFTKWNEWENTFHITDDVEAPDFGIIDDNVLEAAVDAFCKYGSMVFEGADWMEDEEVREMFDDYVENCFIDEEATFRKWTKVKVNIRVEVAI